MAKISKRMQALKATVDRNKLYAVEDAIALVKTAATAKFDQPIAVSVNLGVDPRKSDQAVCGSVVLPRGTAKSVRVAVFAHDANAEAPKAASAV
ncbi:50S ribosomal protein L1, partial [Pseudomonas sp. MWU12-2534b]